MSGVKTLRETCVPRNEVLTGELRDEMFAASLSEVVRGVAHSIYQNPDLFFANTYPTDRVRSFMREIVGRLSGRDNSAAAFFRLDTPFGGGKTHTLIGLYHLLGSQVSDIFRQSMGVDPSDIPSDPVKIVTVVGGDLNPSDGVEKSGVSVHHMWGEIAYQLGGADGYSLVQNADRDGIAPGPQFLETLAGDTPVLFLIDEPAEYMRRLRSAANQLPAFLKTLSEWVTVAGQRRAFVLTLAWNPETDSGQGSAFAAENSVLNDTIKELESVISRPVRVVTPSQTQDIEPILRRRLFECVDMTAAAETAEVYFDALREAAGHDVMLPTDVIQAGFRQQMELSYPFHPSFVELLNGKLATIPNFQRTRGALRLVSRVIRRMWEREQNDVNLIHPFSIDFSDPGMIEEMIGRLDRAPAYSSVVSYDVSDTIGTAHAQQIDADRFAGHPPYTERVAASVLLHSLVDPPAWGVHIDELMASVLTPEADPAHLRKALEYLCDEAWHLDDDGSKYTFRTEPSLNKIVVDETQTVSNHDVRTEVERRARQTWRSAGLNVSYFPAAAEDLADEQSGRLVIVHWDTASVASSAPGTPPSVQQLIDYKGVQDDYRRYRNTLFFLVADASRIGDMLSRTRRWLALDGLVRNKGRMDELKLSDDHRDRLKKWHGEAQLLARVAITRAYSHLFYPTAAASGSRTTLGHHTIMIEDQGNTPINHTETALKALSDDLDKIKTADDGLLSPVVVRQQVFGVNEGSLPTSALMERYAERPRLPLILTPTYMREVVTMGVRNKTWLYYDSDSRLAYDSTEAMPEVVLEGDHSLILPHEAESTGVRVWKPEPPEPPDEEQGEGPSVREPGSAAQTAYQDTLTASGEARRALADVVADAKDQGWQSFRSLSITWQGDDKGAAAALGSLRALMGHMPGGVAAVKCDLTCEFEDGGEFASTYSGPYGRYRDVAGALETQASQSKSSTVNLVLTLAYDNGLEADAPEMSDLRDALELVALGSTEVTAERFSGGA